MNFCSHIVFVLAIFFDWVHGWHAHYFMISLPVVAVVVFISIFFSGILIAARAIFIRIPRVLFIPVHTIIKYD